MTRAGAAAEQVAVTPQARPSAGPYLVLATVALGTLLAPLNSTMVAVALPEIRGDLHVGHTAVGWLVSSYLIAMAVTQPVGGRLGDELGRARVFRVGLVAFLGFSLCALAAPNFALLLIFRTLQAVAGAILIPNGMAMMRTAVPPERFGRFSGLNSSVIGSTAALGPLLGGGLLALGSWRWLFVANIPVIVVALLLVPRLDFSRTDGQRREPIDWTGVALFAALLGFITVFLQALASNSGAGPTVAWGVASAVAVGLFAWRQFGSPSPAAEWRLFGQRSFAGASSHILLMNLGMYTTLLAIPFFLTEVQGRSAALAGLLLAGMAALQALVAPLAGWLADARGRRLPALLSSITALGAAIMLLVGVRADVPVAYLAVSVVILGVGVGLGFVSAQVAAVESVPRRQAGSAAGTQSMMRYLGSIVGAGLLAGLLDTNEGAPGIGAFRALFGVLAAMLALSLVAATLIRPRARTEE